MAIVEFRTNIHSWLRNRTKAELTRIITANIDKINLFADPPPGGPDTPLKAEVKAEQVCFSLGIETLAEAFERSVENNPWSDEAEDYKQEFRIVDQTEFAKDICRAMNDEGEDGSTPLTRFLDQMCQQAADQGSLGMDECPTERPQAPAIAEEATSRQEGGEHADD